MMKNFQRRGRKDRGEKKYAGQAVETTGQKTIKHLPENCLSSASFALSALMFF